MIRQITREELMSMCTTGRRFTLVDVLPRESYEREHIPGAISLPVGEIDRSAAQMLAQGGAVVTYCANFDCPASTRAAEKLEALGVREVLDYKGGLKDYREAGMSLEGSAHEGIHCETCCACH